MKIKKILSMICFMLVISMILPGVQFAYATDQVVETVQVMKDKEIDDDLIGSDLIRDDLVTPMFTNIGNFINTFDIVNGQAYVSSFLSSYSTTHSIIYVYLHVKDGNGWTTYNYWMNTAYASGGSTNVFNTISPSAFAVPRGTYRLQASAYVYNGSTFLESASYTSGSITY